MLILPTVMPEETKVETKVQVIAETEVNETPVENPNEKKAATKPANISIPYFSAGNAVRYFAEAKVICACGNKFTTGSTKEEIRVEICNNCHPFFTGQEKFVDTEGRVERFKRMEDAKKETKTKKDVGRKAEQPKTLKEMLQSLQNR